MKAGAPTPGTVQVQDGAGEAPHATAAARGEDYFVPDRDVYI